jgi:hypothetical protein
MAFATAPNIGTQKSKLFFKKLALNRMHTTLLVNPDDPSNLPTMTPLTLGLYVDGFIYISANHSVKAKFQHLLSHHFTKDTFSH